MNLVESGLASHVLKLAIAYVAEKPDVGLAVTNTGRNQIHEPIVVVVEGDHAGALTPTSRRQFNLLELPGDIAQYKQAWSILRSNCEVHPTIFVEVERGDRVCA